MMARRAFSRGSPRLSRFSVAPLGGRQSVLDEKMAMLEQLRDLLLDPPGQAYLRRASAVFGWPTAGQLRGLCRQLLADAG